MIRSIPFLLLFAVTVLLQVFLFDNLSMSIYVNPLIYIAFIALLPMDTPPALLLLAALAMGVTMDWAMGAAGENTIATLLIAFVRPWILHVIHGHENVREGGVPSAARLGAWKFVLYLAALVVVHNVVFFSLEALSWAHAAHTLLRIVLSGAVSTLFIWLIAQVFTTKFPTRI